MLALEYAKRGKTAAVRLFLILTLLLGALFLVNKSVEWMDLFDHGFTFNSGLPATSFYITTGTHGAHVLAGLIVLMYLISKTFKTRFLKDDYQSIENFGIYWHFVDAVWVFLFPLFYLI